MSEPESVFRDADLDEVDIETQTQWGCRLPGGLVRWDPRSMPYTEDEARFDAERSRGQVVTRTVATTTRTTPWASIHPEVGLTRLDAIRMLDQLRADREQSTYWQSHWADSGGHIHIEDWLDSLVDALPRPETA